MGLLYGALVSYVQEQLPDRHGITAWLVVGGVLWTLFGVLMLEGLAYSCGSCCASPRPVRRW